ncbi:MAG: hypothetical protein KatS3mg111_0826 [Pirellulaceae bacterium]|nr:MAG: hypothetical protein KatS3mg111_0826 [Pirellulaceae bacterium]
MTESTNHLTALDNEARLLGKLYGRALLDASGQQVDEVLAELSAVVVEILDRFPRFEELLRSPRITAEEKERMLDRIFSGRVSGLLLNFLKVLCRRQRIGYLRAITAVAQELRNEQLGRMQVVVRTPQPLSDDQRARIREALRQRFGKEAELVEQVDSNLLGGVVLVIGDQVIDGSVTGMLDAMEGQILQRVQRAVREQAQTLVSS